MMTTTKMIEALTASFNEQFDYIERTYQDEKKATAMSVQKDAVLVVARWVSNNAGLDYKELARKFGVDV